MLAFIGWILSTHPIRIAFGLPLSTSKEGRGRGAFSGRNSMVLAVGFFVLKSESCDFAATRALLYVREGSG